MAPADNPKIKGMYLLIMLTVNIPTVAAIGSPLPVKNEHKTVFPLEYPSSISDAPTISPSGMFWTPIAKARFKPAEILPDPYPTPMAKPSGILCIATAMPKSSVFM